jgi:transposase
MNYIGMDIHKRFTFAVVKDGQGNKITEDKFDNSEDNFSRFLQPFNANETKIVMESTGVWEYIYEILESMKYEVKLANPAKTKAIAYAKVKTDSVDASTLADLLRANLVAESYIPSKEIRALRELTRLRKMATKQRTQSENRLHALLTRKGIIIPNRTLCNKSIKFLREFEKEPLIEEFLEVIAFQRERESNIKKKVEETSLSNKDALLLMSFPGIGAVRALEIVAEIGEIKRFPTAEKLASYAGLVPSIKQSGNSLRLGGLIRQASKTLKHAFLQIAWCIVRRRESNLLQEFYKKLAKKKGKQKAICATARKTCCVIHAMLRKQEPFRYS